MFTYCLTQCSSDDTLPFLCEWQHAKVGTIHVLLPELHLWTESIYFIHICEQVFFRSCIRVFSSFRYWNISAMYASLAHHSTLISSFASLHLSFVKNTFSSSRSSFTRANTLPRDNHWTSVWRNKTLCSTPISSHRDGNMRLFSDLAFTKFIIHTTSSSTGARSAGKVLAASCSRAKKSV